jgi:hypothetical protein
MVNEIRIYFEGNEDLRPGFMNFFSEIRDAAKNRRFRFRLVDSGSKPIDDYITALESNPRAWNFVLIDSEGPYNEKLLRQRCKNEGLEDSHFESVFWMVQMMESWFLADREALKQYYDQRFRDNSLPPNPKIEAILKEDITKGLKRATKNCKKGEYHKRDHAPFILSKLNPELVKQASPHCRRIFDTVLERLSRVRSARSKVTSI